MCMLVVRMRCFLLFLDTIESFFQCLISALECPSTLINSNFLAANRDVNKLSIINQSYPNPKNRRIRTKIMHTP